MTHHGHDLLAAFREHHGPSEAAVERIEQRLRALGPVAAPGKIVALPTRRHRRPIIPVAAIAIAIAVAAAVVLGWWIRGEMMTPTDDRDASMAEDQAEPAAQTRATVPSPRSTVPVPLPSPSPSPRSTVPLPLPSPEAAPEPLPVPEPEPANKVRPRPRAKPVPRPPPPTTAPSSTLADEIRLIQAARGQLSRADPRRALSTLDDYRSRFPKGTMREEADAVRTMARCRLGDGDAGAFTRKYPRSLFRTQVDNACKTR